ncbi:MAG: hypothetical protein ACTH4Y_08265 [Microbacterium gubbeenense]|uniref:hypothetical protein n=1 Tax=Microbacterium gubbeenense TaxID=159896 RepID=UPI003F99FA8C
MRGWLIYKSPTPGRYGRRWRVSDRPGIWFLYDTHAEAVAHMNNVVAANKHFALAA